MSFAEGSWLVEWYSWAAMEPLLSRREGFSSPEQCPGCRAEMMPGRCSPDGLGQAAKATFSCRFGAVSVQWTWNWYKESKCGPLSEQLASLIQLFGEINSELWSYFLGKKNWLTVPPAGVKNQKCPIPPQRAAQPTSSSLTCVTCVNASVKAKLHVSKLCY